MEEITTRTLDAQGLTPSRAFAALRAKAQGRGAFLLEMTEPDERGEQRSTIGFLAKRESAYPPISDALRDFAATSAELPAPSDRPEVATACCNDALALLMFDAVLPASRLAPWPEQSFLGREMRDVASVVFDHVARTITLAATNPNVVERCARVLAAAPELRSLPPLDETRPDHWFEHPPDLVFIKQLGKAQRRLKGGPLSRLAMARTFTVPPRGADLFDVFLAMKEIAPMRHHFFIEYGTSPMYPGFAATGAASRAIHIAPQPDAAALAKELRALFPIEASCGTPEKDALTAWREVEAGPRGLRGGLVTRIRPGGSAEVLCPETFVILEGEQLHTTGLADVIEGRDAAAHSLACSEDVAVAFAAMRLAQDESETRATVVPE